MGRMAGIDSRRGVLIVSSWWPGPETYPLFHLGDWARRAAEPVSDRELGQLTREALAACRVSEHVPDLRDNPEGERRVASLHKLAGVRSERGYAVGTRHVSVLWDESEQDMTITPHAGDYNGGFSGLEPDIHASADVDDAVLGTAIRQALAACRTI